MTVAFGVDRALKQELTGRVSSPEKFLPVFFGVMQGTLLIADHLLVFAGGIAEGLKICPRLMNRTVRAGGRWKKITMGKAWYE